MSLRPQIFQTNFCKDNFRHVVILGAYLAAFGDTYGNEQDDFNAAMNLYFTNAFFQSGCELIVKASKNLTRGEMVNASETSGISGSNPDESLELDDLDYLERKIKPFQSTTITLDVTLCLRLINMALKAQKLQNEVAAMQVELDGADSVIENLKKEPGR